MLFVCTIYFAKTFPTIAQSRTSVNNLPPHSFESQVKGFIEKEGKSLSLGPL